MTRFIYDTAASLDGWIADPDDSLAWLFAVPDAHAAENDPQLTMTGQGAMVEGSTTYEWMLAESNILESPERWREFHGDLPVFLFTTRELPAPEGADVRFLRGAVAESLPAIREAAGGKDVWIVGGGDLAGQFLDAGALDEVRISIAPVALGAGAPLLPRRVESDRLELIEAKAVGQFARLRYRVR